MARLTSWQLTAWQTVADDEYAANNYDQNMTDWQRDDDGRGPFGNAGDMSRCGDGVWRTRDAMLSTIK